jgi:hypothetical protein
MFEELIGRAAMHGAEASRSDSPNKSSNEEVLETKLRRLQAVVDNHDHRHALEQRLASFQNTDDDDEDIIHDVPSEFLCPITYGIMEDPVMAPDTYTYERSAIVTWLQQHHTSPMTRERIGATLLPNRSLALAIERWRTEHSQLTEHS